jgi:hypothetical protein
VDHDEISDPYNATTFGLTKAGYTFAGWKVIGTDTILDQDTSYVSTVYTDYKDSTISTANTAVVYCWLEAQWEPNTANFSALFNNQQITSIVFNGQAVEHLVFNGISIF